VFITRASRHDKADLQEFFESQGWDEVDLNEGVALMARDGSIVAGLRLVEVAPQSVVVDDVVVREERRREGIGTRLIQAAMNSRGGTLYLCCHDEIRNFYRPLGFDDIDVIEAPPEVVAFWRKVDDYPTPEGHVHYFMRAR
jgi:GNAT superfamily N-acetyltransferase